MMYQPDMANLYTWFMENRFKNKFFIDNLNYLFPLVKFAEHKYGVDHFRLIQFPLNYIFTNDETTIEHFKHELLFIKGMNKKYTAPHILLIIALHTYCREYDLPFKEFGDILLLTMMTELRQQVSEAHRMQYEDFINFFQVCPKDTPIIQLQPKQTIDTSIKNFIDSFKVFNQLDILIEYLSFLKNGSFSESNDLSPRILLDYLYKQYAQGEKSK